MMRHLFGMFFVFLKHLINGNRLKSFHLPHEWFVPRIEGQSPLTLSLRWGVSIREMSVLGYRVSVLGNQNLLVLGAINIYLL